MRSRPYELAQIAGGYEFRTRRGYRDILRRGHHRGGSGRSSPLEQLVLTAVAYFQPVTRMSAADILGKPVSRAAISAPRSAGLIAAGPQPAAGRAPKPM